MSEGTPNWLKPDGEATQPEIPKDTATARAIEHAREARARSVKRRALKGTLSAFKLWWNAPANTANEAQALDRICDLIEEIGVLADGSKS